MYKVITFFLAVFCFSLQAQVRLTEIAPTNTGQLQDDDGDLSDWIEIRNGSTQIVNFLNWGITDGSSANRWLLPAIDLDPGERLLVFASGKNRGSSQGANGVDHWETAVNEGDNWHYYVGNANPPANWTSLAFDDSVWPSGPGGFGYGDNDDATVLPTGTLSVYYRQIFQVTDANQIKQMVLSMDYDDGFIAYLNGQEIARSSTVSGQPNWNTLVGDHEATFYNLNAYPEPFTVSPTLIASFLQNGPNVLAVQVHNALTNSSDLTGRTWLHAGIGSSNQFFGANPWWFVPPDQGFSGVLHTDFTLQQGERVRLFDALGNLADSVTLQPLQPGHSFMRINDDGFWCITPNPTPGVENGFDCENAYSATPVFSLNSGFYNGIQSVSISGPGAIRYTTDGSEPIATSLLYSGPIQVTQNTVLRARCFENFKLPGATATATYFIDENVTLPVVAITLPPEDFSEVYTNYSRKGQVSLEFFDKNKQKQFSDNYAAYVVGNWSVGFPQKSLQFDVDEDFGSQGEIKYQLFPDKGTNSYHSFRIRNEDDDWTQARMRDRIVNELAAPTHAGHAAYLNVIAFINGQYWGHYVARERLDNYFCRDNYGADPDSVTLVKTYFNLNQGTTLDEAEHGTLDDFYAMSDFISGQNMADPNQFAQAGKLLDLNNFTDYLATEIFVASTDWLQDYYNNIRLFKSDWNDPWKFVLWDVSYSSGNPLGGSTCAACDVLGTTLTDDSRYGEMLRSLLQNTEYRRYFINRFADLMNTNFLPSRAHELIDVNAAEMAAEIQRHHELWGTGDLGTWQNAVQTLRTYYQDRPEYQRQHLVDRFQLDGQVNITLQANPPGAGTIQISTVIPESLPWSGVYFHGNPVTLTAIPNPGYTFANWSVSPFINNLTSATFTADISGNTVFTANFTGQAQAAALRITEINYHSDPSRNAGDWLEIQNQGNHAMDLSGYWLRDKDWFHRYDIPTGTVIPAGARLVLYENEQNFQQENPGVNQQLGPINFQLDNDGDDLYLYDRAGSVALSMTYKDGEKWPCTADGFGGTLERENGNNDPNEPESWFDGCTGGSAGTVYSPCAEMPVISEINYNSAPAADAGDWIELFNTTFAPMDLSDWQISDASGNTYTIPQGTVLSPTGYWVFYADQAKFSSQFPNVTNAVGPMGFGFSAAGDMVRFYRPDGRLYWSMCFDDKLPWPEAADGDGYTLENESVAGRITDPENWFAGCPGGSPGTFYDPNCGNVDTDEPFQQTFQLSVWPNPAFDQINIQTQPGTNIHYRWINTLGQPIQEIQSSVGLLHFSIQNWPPGIYWLQATRSDGKTAVEKIVRNGGR